METLLIFIFGGTGCLARYGLSGLVYRVLGASFPFGTLAVNFLGSLFLGGFVEWSLRTIVLSPDVRNAVAVGFFGGFTTFSTFSYETAKLVEEGSWALAGLNIAASVFLCLIGALGGILIVRKVL
ncbi:MAG: fluoride efflux transporter CrcB [Deltaproteobacteria bacterium]|nr:MAG: fluoride efflux transporter CrcB [Deltaproteobacteria bacterium]